MRDNGRVAKGLIATVSKEECAEFRRATQRNDDVWDAVQDLPRYISHVLHHWDGRRLCPPTTTAQTDEPSHGSITPMESMALLGGCQAPSRDRRHPDASPRAITIVPFLPLSLLATDQPCPRWLLLLWWWLLFLLLYVSIILVYILFIIFPMLVCLFTKCPTVLL